MILKKLIVNKKEITKKFTPVKLENLYLRQLSYYQHLYLVLYHHNDDIYNMKIILGLFQSKCTI